MMKKQTYNVEGMKCQHCQAHVQSALQQVKGVQEVEVSLDNGTATLLMDDASVELQQLQQAVSAVGSYRLTQME